MHQTTVETGQQLHECFNCGRRVADPDGRVCDNCGSDLQNISRPRDL